MDFRLITYFLALCEEENFTIAANRLGITQPTLSKEIKNLEYDLGKELIIRGKRRISLTEEGMYLKKHGQEILDLAEKVELGIKNFDNDIHGDVYIGSAETEIFNTLAQTIRDVSRDYPNIRFHVYDGNTDDIQNKIDTGSLSFGLIFSNNTHDKYHYLHLKNNNCWGVLMNQNDSLAHKEHICPEDLMNKPLILTSRKKSQSHILNWFDKGIDELNVICEINLIYNASILVKNNCGYAFSINGLIKDPDLTFIPLDPPIYQYPKIIWKRHTSFSRAEKVFLSYLKESVLKDINTLNE